MPIASIFLHYFYNLVSSVFRGRALCHGPILGDPLEKSETDSKEYLFLELTMFLRQKINKIGTDSKLRLFFRNHYNIFCDERLTICKFSFSLFNQMLLDQVLFDQLSGHDVGGQNFLSKILNGVASLPGYISLFCHTEHRYLIIFPLWLLYAAIGLS